MKPRESHPETLSTNITDIVRSPTLTTILQWLRSNHKVHPRAILTDCDKSLTKAIAATYTSSINAPKHFWCAVHVIKAARRRAGEYVRQKTTLISDSMLKIII